MRERELYWTLRYEYSADLRDDDPEDPREALSKILADPSRSKDVRLQISDAEDEEIDINETVEADES